MTRLLKYLLVSKALVASAIEIKMDEKRGIFFSDIHSNTNFQFQPFPFNPAGKAPPTRGRSVKERKKEEKQIIRIPVVAHIFQQDSRCGAHFSLGFPL